MNPDWVYLEAIKCAMATSKSLWMWLCENHPQIALEYEEDVKEGIE